jgi:hypothetical protein
MLDDLATGEFLVRYGTFRPPWRVAIPATGERLDKIAAAFEWGLGANRCGK